MKVYKPFLPLLSLVILIGVVAVPYFNGRSAYSTIAPTDSRQVLAYATDVTSGGLLSATNQRRAQAGLAPLAANAQLSQAAQAKATDMANRNYWAHNTPDGVQPWTFIANTGYNYTRAGENLACGFNDSNAVITGWYNSPSHRDNMLGAAYKDVGFGIVNAPAYNCGDFPTSQQTIVVAMYGTPYVAPSSPAPAPSNQTPQPQAATTRGSQAAQEPSQEGESISHTVTLTVTNDDGAPAADVAVTFQTESKSATTGKDGRVVFTDVKTGQHTVAMEVAGAKSEIIIDLTNQPADFSKTVLAPELTSNKVIVDSSDSLPAVEQKKISRLDLLTANFAVEIIWVMALAVIAGGCYVLGKYSVAAHKFFVKGEKYIHKHKYVDAAVIALIIALYLLTRNVAAIL